MLITESELRRIIRQVIAESMLKNSRGNINWNMRGKEITPTEVRKFRQYFGDYFLKDSSNHANLLIKLLSGEQGNTNEVVIDPSSTEDIKWAEENEPFALMPLFVIDSKDLKEELNVIVFKEVGGKKRHYKKMLNGEDFVDQGSSEYHGVDSRIKYSNKEQEVFRGSKGDVDYDKYDRRERDMRRKYNSISPDGLDV